MWLIYGKLHMIYVRNLQYSWRCELYILFHSIMTIMLGSVLWALRIKINKMQSTPKGIYNLVRISWEGGDWKNCDRKYNSRELTKSAFLKMKWLAVFYESGFGGMENNVLNITWKQNSQIQNYFKQLENTVLLKSWS